ncbi:MAG: protein kinase [Chloroflexota bacterium]
MQLDSNTDVINGRYTLHEKIGQGGMGIVHRATDRLTGETVALKQVYLPVSQLFFTSRSTVATAHGLRLALTHEFQTLASMRHPNIISVLDYGFDAEKRPFFTMPFLENAQTILEAGDGRSVPEKVALLVQALDALAYLHRRGILHRDLKPDNVLVVDNTVRVLDFGLAAATEQATGSVGSWHYMAPEVLQGGIATEASDLYAVGVLAFQLFAQEHPFNLHAADLREEVLNSEPQWEDLAVDEQLRTLIRTLLSKDPAQRPQTADEATIAFNFALGQEMPEETAVIRESYLQAATFVGRETELAQLKAALAQAQTNTAAVWLLGGESGVGKSRLLEEIRTYALVSGWHVHKGQAVLEEGMPYQIWQEIVPRLTLGTELSDLEASILQEIYPALDHLLARPLPPVPELSGEAAEQRLALTLVELLKRQTEPTLLLLEDLQWAQRGLAPLQQLLKVTEQLSGIMLIGTYRDDEGPELPNTLAGSNTLQLARLSDAEISQLSRSMLGQAAHSPQLTSLLRHETEGNTFFIVEVMRALAEEAGHLADIGQLTLPTSILTSGMNALLQRRLKRVSAADRPLLLLAAVAGRQVDEQLLQALSPDAAIGPWLQRAADTAVLEVRDNQWQFSHDKLREAMLAQLQLTQLRDAHRQVALAIEQVYPQDVRYYPRLLTHWQTAEDEEKELGYLLPVVNQIVELAGNYKQGSELITRGLAILPPADNRRVTLLNLQANICLIQAKFVEAEKTAKQALRLAQTLHDERSQATSLNILGSVSFEQSQYRQAETLFQQSLAIAQTVHDQKSMAQNLINLGSIAEFQKRYPLAEQHFRQGLALSQEIGYQQGMVRCFFYLGMLAAQYHNDYEVSFEYGRQALTFSQAIGDRRGIARAFSSLGIDNAAIGNYAVARDYLQQNLVIKQAIGDQVGIAHAYLILGESYYFEGIGYEQIVAYEEQALQILLDRNAYAIAGIAYGYLTLGHVALGAYDKALDNALSHFELYSTLDLDKSNGLVHVAVAQILFACEAGDVPRQEIHQHIADISALTALEPTPIAYISEAVRTATISQIRMVILMECGDLALKMGEMALARSYLAEVKTQVEKIGNQHKLRQVEALFNRLAG